MSGVKTNYAYNLVNTVSGLLFPLITFPYAARVLLADGIGQVQFYTSIITYISLFSSIGIPLYAVREIAKVKGDAAAQARTAAEILLLHLTLTLLGYAAVAVLCLTVNDIKADIPLFLVLSVQMVFTVIGCEWFYQGIEEFKYITVRNVAVKTAATICLFLLVKTKDDLMMYAVYTVMATVGNNIFNFFRLRKYLGHRVGRFSDLNIFRHLGPASRIFVLNLITSIYVNLDTVMLGFISGATAVGYYTGATKLTRMLLGIVTALGTVMIPKMSHLHASGNTDEFGRLARKSLGFVNFISLPMAAGLAILAPSLINVFCGASYAPAADTLLIISPIILFISLSNVTGIQILYPQGRERTVIISTLIGAVLNFILNLILIPEYQQNGAAAATVVAELSVTLSQVIIAGKYIPGKIVSAGYANYYIGTVLMSAVCIALRFAGMGALLEVIVIPAAGIFTYGLWLLLRKDRLMAEILRSMKIPLT